MAYSNRPVARDGVFFDIFRGCLQSYTKDNELGYYGTFFASLLGHESRTADVQFLSGLQEHSSRRISFDEVLVLIRKIGPYARPAVNQMLTGTGLVCVPADSPDIQNISNFSALHLIRSGELAGSLLSALDDDRLDKKEKAEIHANIDSLIGFLSSLRETVEEYGHG